MEPASPLEKRALQSLGGQWVTLEKPGTLFVGGGLSRPEQPATGLTTSSVKLAGNTYNYVQCINLYSIFTPGSTPGRATSNEKWPM